ncbi:MAG: DNA-binding response regulator [Bacillus thermozeamaize]|uniref:DNA-binding response regulator n=1 Tax=Bacillus thermozeamaize TaxID=230954 RepID=A0A1Y3PPL1_9BACI|nr:MAG: DNA-binding response regulator [Bacillus thermozeamaize]
MGRETILVVDDDLKITALLRRVLAADDYQVRTANDGQSGLAMALDEEVDLVVLDVMLPGVSGWEICRLIRQKRSVPILMLTAKGQVEDKVKGLDSGADDYLVKPFALEEFLARVRALLRRRRTSGEAGVARQEREWLQFADLRLNRLLREAERGGRKISLTSKEYELLSCFLEHPNRVLSRDFLMERVWGYDFEGESNVLEVYIANLRQKLEESGESRLIHTVRGVGYVLREG